MLPQGALRRVSRDSNLVCFQRQSPALTGGLAPCSVLGTEGWKGDMAGSRLDGSPRTHTVHTLRGVGGDLYPGSPQPGRPGAGVVSAPQWPEWGPTPLAGSSRPTVVVAHLGPPGPVAASWRGTLGLSCCVQPQAANFPDPSFIAQAPEVVSTEDWLAPPSSQPSFLSLLC